jgi:hypothetical protein
MHLYKVAWRRLSIEMAISTRQIYVSTKNVHTEGLPEPQNDVAGSYTLATVTDYDSVWEQGQDTNPNAPFNGGIYRRAALVKVVRTGDQRS